ncbi:uncharacterized protein [Fopius arisanus]|uniref:Apple domain-containing protein n=1 Tax=Fopius arisanus TaxID=64838 RepID=A0A9R1TF34_9HYME|nr:PREDICTED: uncharacterized protein LOC105269541 [Fopius arisanus]
MKNQMDKAGGFLGRGVYLIFLGLSSLLDDGHSLDLTIDNRLFVVPPDCYARVSIGSRLADSLVISTSQVNTAGDCEAACSANGTSCSSFSFGIGNRGNGTCVLGSRAPDGRLDLQRDPNYDVYVKGKISLRGCQARTGTSFVIPSTPGPPPGNQNGGDPGPLSINADRSQRLFGNSSLLSTFGNSIFNRNRNNRSGIIRNPFDFTSDDRLRISDILQNKKGRRTQDYEKSGDEKSHFQWKFPDDSWSPDSAFGWHQVVQPFNPFPIPSKNHFEHPDYSNYGELSGNHDFLGIEGESLGDTFGRRLNPKIYGGPQVSTLLKKDKPEAGGDDYVSAFDDTFGFGQRLTQSDRANDFLIYPS